MSMGIWMAAIGPRRYQVSRRAGLASVPGSLAAGSVSDPGRERRRPSAAAVCDFVHRLSHSIFEFKPQEILGMEFSRP